MALNRRVVSVDVNHKMSTPHHTAASGHTAPNDVEVAGRFAHELSNLLDGSMRNVALVRSLMSRQTEGHDAVATGEADVLARLQTAEQGMRKMVTLIRNWMSQHSPSSAIAPVAESGETLADAINHARDLHHPAANALGIDINLHVTAEAARLPAGNVFPVLANGLRNSIEAISADPARGDRTGIIDVRAQVQGGQVRLSIADNGPGLSREVLDTGGIFRFGKTTKPGGHGHGLSLCRDIAAGLNGTLRMANRDDGGAVLTLTYPVAENTNAGKLESRK